VPIVGTHGTARNGGAVERSPDEQRELADEAEIRNVVARLAHLADVDGDDLERYLALWTPDGVSVHPDWEAHGHDGLRRAVHDLRSRGIQGPGANTLHLNTTLVVDVDGSDRATAESYWQHWDVSSMPPVIRSIGRYRDSFVRTDDGWKLHRRVVTYGADE
jgi:hypothetical protein